ncbi:DUF1801 domain-containing protein [Seonamhaeicola sp. ML3]|uniref:DUF1801 domain-containing protein n=1 Tax=Seonamhaeicola sp. ML3 TaxID=2937786 RepID=UPI00200F9FA2|nr:DUF1801 domain-containing protein [Seonamhaeicola sp. ML3]
MKLISNPKVEHIFENYPNSVKTQMLFLRDLILETANEMEEITQLEETLKWGEPSYIAKHGSTLRIHWSSKSPNQYAMYFQCTSRLVTTFRLVFRDTFSFDGKRAIVFKLGDSINEEALKQCIKATLNYHKVKHLPMLGI